MNDLPKPATMDDFAAMNAVWDAWVVTARHPTLRSLREPDDPRYRLVIAVVATP